VNYHYDHPVEFWKLWLDESLCYSCAYFESPQASLSEAQNAKLDYICRKLRLRPGQRLLDMGSGWGALVMHAAANYGVESSRWDGTGGNLPLRCGIYSPSRRRECAHAPLRPDAD
jgi:cyclopropane-fatty-acyl-phospholipid synthase